MAIKQRQGFLQLVGDASYLRVSGFNCSLLQALSIALAWSSMGDNVTRLDALRARWSLNDLLSKYIRDGAICNCQRSYGNLSSGIPGAGY